MSRSVYIPGKREDTPIYKMRNRPMMCTKCLHYGHPRKYCRAEEVSCRRCAESGHTTENCAAESPKCLHCGGAHQAGHKDCERHQKEEQLIEIQHNLKVTLRRARQIIENNNEFTEPIRTTYNTHIDLSIDRTLKRQFSPWLLEKCLTGILGQKPKSIR